MSDRSRREKLEAMLAEDPADEFLRYGLAMDYAGTGDHETAVKQLRELIGMNPAKPYVPAFLMAAQSLQKMGRVSEAIPMLRDGVAAAQKQGNAHAAGEME